MKITKRNVNKVVMPVVVDIPTKCVYPVLGRGVITRFEWLMPEERLRAQSRKKLDCCPLKVFYFLSLSLCLSVLLSHFLSKPANKFWNITKQRLSSLNAKLVRTCQPNPLMKYRKKWLLYQGHFTSFAALRWLPFWSSPFCWCCCWPPVMELLLLLLLLLLSKPPPSRTISIPG